MESSFSGLFYIKHFSQFLIIYEHNLLIKHEGLVIYYKSKILSSQNVHLLSESLEPSVALLKELQVEGGGSGIGMHKVLS